MLSLGIDLNTKTQLGISPINSVPFNVHQLTGLPLHARHGTHRKAHLRPYREALRKSLLNVKTTGVAGGLHKPYKGKGQPRLKAHEKVRQSQHYYGLPPTGGGSLFALAYWLTRERVGKFFQADLVRGYVFL